MNRRCVEFIIANMWHIHLLFLLSYVPLPVRTQQRNVQHFSDLKAGRISWVVDEGVLPWTGTYSFVPSKLSQSTVLLTVVDSSNGNHLGECTSSKGSNDWSKFSWTLSEDSLLCNVSGSVVSKVRFPPTKDPRTFSVRILAGRGPRCFRNMTIENEQIVGCPPSLNRNLFQSTSFECGCDYATPTTLPAIEKLTSDKGSNTSISPSPSSPSSFRVTTIAPPTLSNAAASNSDSFVSPKSFMHSILPFHNVTSNGTNDQTRLPIDNQLFLPSNQTILSSSSSKRSNQSSFITPFVFETTPWTLNTQPCALVECLNNGTCVLGPDGQASCLCLEGFNGERCEFSLCATMPCMNGGVCRVAGAESVCDCPPGVTGILCEQAICDPLCENGGSCELVNGTAICQCLPGTTGINCNLIDVCADASTCAVFGEHARCRLDAKTLTLISPVPVNASYKCECANDRNEWVNCLELAMQAGPFASVPSIFNKSQPTNVNATNIESSISFLNGFNRSSSMNTTNKEPRFNVSGELPFPHLNTQSPTFPHSIFVTHSPFITATESSEIVNEFTTHKQNLTSIGEPNPEKSHEFLNGFTFPNTTNTTGLSKLSNSKNITEIPSSSELNSSLTDADLSSAPNRSLPLFPPFSSFTIPNFTNVSSKDLERLRTTTIEPFAPAVNATKFNQTHQNFSKIPWSPFEKTMLTKTPSPTDSATEHSAESDYDTPTDEMLPSTTRQPLETDVSSSTNDFGLETTSNEQTTPQTSILLSQRTTVRSIVVSDTDFEKPHILTTTEAELSTEPATSPTSWTTAATEVTLGEDEVGNEVVTSEFDHYPYASSSTTASPSTTSQQPGDGLYEPDSNQSQKASPNDSSKSSSTSWIIALVIAIVLLLLLAVIALFVVRYVQRSRKLHGKYNPAREENVLANSYSMPMTTVTKEERLI